MTSRTVWARLQTEESLVIMELEYWLVENLLMWRDRRSRGVIVNPLAPDFFLILAHPVCKM
jgi:hypothetical protein